MSELEKDFQFGDHTKKVDYKIDQNEFKTVKNMDIMSMVKENQKIMDRECNAKYSELRKKFDKFKTIKN